MSSSKNTRQQIMSQLRAGFGVMLLIAVIIMLFVSAPKDSFAARPPTKTPTATAVVPTATAAPNGCSSTADCLSKMTLDEKIGQMTQANKNALTTPADIRTYYLGSLLSGGGEGPNGSGGTATEWANMYDGFQLL